MDLSSLPVLVQVCIAMGVGIGCAIAAGWYLSRKLTGGSGTNMSDLMSTLDDKLGAIRKEVERTRGELVNEIRVLDSRVRNLEMGQARMQGMMDKTRGGGLVE